MHQRLNHQPALLGDSRSSGAPHTVRGKAGVSEAAITEARNYLKGLGRAQLGSFERRFAELAEPLGLAEGLDKAALARLHAAAFMARLCHMAMNELGRGTSAPEMEPKRMMLERIFMAARDQLFACPTWTALPPGTRACVEQVFLTVLVEEKNLAH